ncbi:MAG: potassium channel family protein [Actinomycetota bacterium]|nr:potassium channel family protein [Actinomycetota bacterium]
MSKLPVSSRDVIAVLTLIGGGVAFTVAERGQKLDSVDGLWWAFATATTVGYGDIAPKTQAGRMIAAGLMLQRFLSARREAGEDQQELRDRLDEIARRLDALERPRSY